MKIFPQYLLYSLLLATYASAPQAQQSTAGAPAPRAYIDATATHMPGVPRWHAVDAVFIDVDKDGDLDLVVAVEHRANALFINDGAGKMRHVPGVFDKRSHDNEHVLHFTHQRRDQLLGIGAQVLPGLGQIQLAGRAQKKRQAKKGFQCFQAMADGGW